MDYVERVLAEVKERNPGEPEFHQAATEILNGLRPVVAKDADFSPMFYPSGSSGLVHLDRAADVDRHERIARNCSFNHKDARLLAFWFLHILVDAAGSK